MIDQVLDISALEKSGFALNKEAVDIKSLVNEVVGDFLVENPEGVTVETEFKTDNGFTAEIDRFQVTRVFNNLLSNAVKYCEKNPAIRIEVSAEERRLVIRVSDNGVGIPKEARSEVFNKFYRCSYNQPQKIKGLGLGLYFVRRIAEAHGGSAEVESTPGEGATFIIVLPVKTENNETGMV